MADAFLNICIVISLGLAFLCPTMTGFLLLSNDENGHHQRRFWGILSNEIAPTEVDRNQQIEDAKTNDVQGEEAFTSAREDNDNAEQVGVPEMNVSIQENTKFSDVFHYHPNRTITPDMKCQEVEDERFRCCRVYDNVVEAWWCPVRRPFCCQQGTSCAVCCTIDEMRQLESEGGGDGQSGDCKHLSVARRPQLSPAPVDDESWFWNGMKAAWLTMIGVLLASLCCTCIAHKCIAYLVKIVNEEEPDLDDEYLAYHFDQLALVGDDATSPTGRQSAARHGQLPPKYSDINFTPVQADSPINVPAPSEPPPVYTSEPGDAEAVETRMLPNMPITNQA